MIVVDVNLLLNAVLQHTAARAWWTEIPNSDREVGLSSPALFGFLRIATNPCVLTSPLSVDRAVRHITDWLGQPNVRFLTPGPRHLDITFDLLQQVGTAGNLTTDVQLAAFALENEAELCPNDVDFGRFADLRWLNP